MNHFLSVDWGTTNFRLRLIDCLSLQIIAEVSNDQGISNTYALWQKSGEERVAFYLNIIKKGIEEIEQQTSISLIHTPVVVSGMASSSIGLKELPYKMLPVKLEGASLYKECISSSAQFPYTVFLVSGVQTADDVMRGEETQLLGCTLPLHNRDTTFIFTGTHSKHILLQDGLIAEFATYMTGEFFALLSSKSLLAASVNESGNINDEGCKQAFVQGVKESVQKNLLHAAFKVRTNTLLYKLTPEQNYFYLSGLLIGSELARLKTYADTLIIVSNRSIYTYYQLAAEALQMQATVQYQNVDAALIKGQYEVYKTVQHLFN